jgi:Cft2 family RNA processing exonuclease
MISFLPIGGGNEIGANSYYLSDGETGIILDCGMHPVKTGAAALPEFSLLSALPVDHLLISHAHQDHVAAMPYLVKAFPHTRTTMTPQTSALASFALHNASDIMREQNENDGTLKAYTHEEIDLLLRMTREIPYSEEFDVTGYAASGRKHLTAKFYDAGHILGSAGIRLQFKDHVLFYTGDINMSDQFILSKAMVPRGRIDTLILECTLGSTNSAEVPEWKKESERFAKEANKIIAAGGSILVPVFAIGKTQEMLATIWHLMHKGKLVTVPIYTGGMGRRLNRQYDKYRYQVNVRDADLKLTTIPQERLRRSTPPHHFTKDPCIILASSGMVVQKTFSYFLAEYFLRQPKCAIFTVGYMDPTTPGHRIRQSAQGDTIRLTDSSEPTRVECSTTNFRFSAHARREDLLGIVMKMNPANVVLTHGDADAVGWMGKQILQYNKKIRVYAAEQGKGIELSN